MIAKLVSAGYLQFEQRNDRDPVTNAIARMKLDLRTGNRVIRRPREQTCNASQFRSRSNGYLRTQVTIESLIAEAEAARAKAMSEKGGAAAAVSALTAKAKLAGMWREKIDSHNTGAVYERIERVIVERPDEEPTNNSGFAGETQFDEALRPRNGQKPWWAEQGADAERS